MREFDFCREAQLDMVIMQQTASSQTKTMFILRTLAATHGAAMPKFAKSFGLTRNFAKNRCQPPAFSAVSSFGLECV